MRVLLYDLERLWQIATSVKQIHLSRKAINLPKGENHRIGAVRSRSQTQTPSGHWVKRDTSNGQFIDVKTSSKTPFKGVRKEHN